MLKTGLVSLLIGLTLSWSIQAATTLYLDDRLDLLVLDGKKVAPSLLRGAGSLELESGLHQLVVRIESPQNSSPQATAAEIITVDTQRIRRLHFTLTPGSGTDTSLPQIGLRNEKGHPVDVVRDRLQHAHADIADCMELATLQYNRSQGIAAREIFAQGQHPLNCPTPTSLQK